MINEMFNKWMRGYCWMPTRITMLTRVDYAESFDDNIAAISDVPSIFKAPRSQHDFHRQCIEDIRSGM